MKPNGCSWEKSYSLPPVQMSPAADPAGSSRRKRRHKSASDSASPGSPKPSQRERLMTAMLALCAQQGYQAVSIAQVSSAAGVSSATFYEQFESKEECLLTAYQAAAARVLDQMQPVQPSRCASEAEWVEAASQALGRLLQALEREPNAGRVLVIEAWAAGPRVDAERPRILAVFEARAQGLIDSAPALVGTVDLPLVALLGAVRSIVSRHLRTHAEHELPALSADIVAWLQSYARPGRRARWSTGRRATLSTNLGPPRVPAAPVPARLPRGRHRLPPGIVAHSRRTRLVYATAEVTFVKSYEDATVADIVAAAGVARDVFYEHFTDKQHAFLEAQQHAIQDILDACVVAYFSAKAWPERVWRGLETLLGVIGSHPALAHLRLVECYAAGPEAIRRADEITRACAILLEEGYSYRPQARDLPRLCSQAITGAIFEVVQRHVAEADTEGLLLELPRLVYIAIAPFTGAEEAVALIERIRKQDSKWSSSGTLAIREPRVNDKRVEQETGER